MSAEDIKSIFLVIGGLSGLVSVAVTVVGTFFKGEERVLTAHRSEIAALERRLDRKDDDFVDLQRRYEQVVIERDLATRQVAQLQQLLWDARGKTPGGDD